MILIPILFLLAYIGGGIYFGVRMYTLFAAFLPVFFQGKLVFGLVVAFLSLFYLIFRIVSRHKPVAGWFYYFVSSTLAIYVIMLVFLIVLDLVLLVTHIFPGGYAFMQSHMGVIGIIYIAAVMLGYGLGLVNANVPMLTKYEIAVAKAVPDMRIVLVSDIHVASHTSKNNIRRMAAKINSLNADLVLFGGDTIDGEQRPYVEKNIAAIMQGIKSRHGIYGILGNHEYYGEHIDNAVEILNNSGIKMLVDEVAAVDALNVTIVGRDDMGAHLTRKYLRKTMKELLMGVDKSGLLIVLDHQPQLAQEAKDEGVDFLLAGHTHNGQIFPGNIVVKLLFEKAWGYKASKNFHLIVSCGYGTWGPPIRTAGYSEIVVIDVKGKNQPE